MRRVVITGVGAVSPCGLDTRSTWDNIVAGRSGIERIALLDPAEFPSQIGGECKGFVAEQWIEKRRLKECDRFIVLGIAATHHALESSGFAPSEEEKTRTGTFVGVGICGLEYMQRVAETLLTKGPRRITPYFIPATIANLAPGQIAMRWGFKGPSYTTTSACSSGAHAIGEAFRWIQRGDCDTAIAGGTEAAITGLGVGGFAAMKALSTRNDAPNKASRPFDIDRDGFVIAEGAGMIVLEDVEHAQRRGANILAEIVGYGATTDAYHITQPAPEGAGAQRAMQAAIRDARVNTSDIDYINVHGTSTPTGDIAEVQAIKAVFGDHVKDKLWVSSTKSMTGHLLGAAGGLESVLCALAIKHGVVPPTINLDSLDPECAGLDFVAHESRPRKLRTVLNNSFGFGGTNVSLVFKEFV